MVKVLQSRYGLNQRETAAEPAPADDADAEQVGFAW